MRIRALLIALLAAVLSIGTSPAFAYGTGGFTVANVQLLSYGCFYHPYQINLNLGAETTEWSVDARVLAPNGSVFDSANEYGTGSGARALPEEMFFCSSIDPTGTYTITGTLQTYEGASDYTPTTVSLTPASFQVSPYTAPPAPPAPLTKSLTSATLKAKKLTAKVGPNVQFTFRVSAVGGPPYFMPAPTSVTALLERKTTTGWAKYLKPRTVTVGVAVRIKKTFRHSGVMKVRARVIGGTSYTASTSKSVTVYGPTG